ncbi:MAG: DUF5060 domain-containing protein [Planctomycetes bacterium]|nr:DUF5060 domain-containing protein [Planctomycetota bacterium]
MRRSSWFVVLLSMGLLPLQSCAADGLRILRQGSYEVGVSGSGGHSLTFAGDRIINYEMLQLIDKSKEWRVVFVYGKDGDPERKFIQEKGASVCDISQDKPKIIFYKKHLSVAPDGVRWTIDYEAQAKTGAQWSYYFLDIPMNLVSDAVILAKTAQGDRAVVLGSPDRSPHVGFAGVHGVTFTTPRYEIAFTLKGENVTWLLTDWTKTMHKSYRLRIEAPCEQGIKARVEVRVTVKKSSPELLARRKEELRKMAEAKRRKRMLELGIVCEKKLKIGKVEKNKTSVKQCEKFELTFPLDATFDNPFDPEQVDVVCRFKSPSGKTFEIPAFFYQDFKRRPDPEAGYDPAGRPVWKVRFAPRETGRYEYRITVKDRNSKAESAPGEFECVAARTKGYVRVSKRNPYYFEFESGELYIPIGVNLFYSTRLGRPIPPERLPTCEKYMNRVADGGGNFVRLRMDSWFSAIEMAPDKATGYLGLGYYHQGSSWEVDRLYELAERRGIYIMHCLDNANANVNLRSGKHAGKKIAWRASYDHYLKKNGGVTDSHQDFWTNEEVQRFVRNKLRYVVARWGWSPNSMCWEFWNEVSLRKDIIDACAAWLRDTARYLRSIDPYEHPITTSVMGDHGLMPRIFGLPEMEINQIHCYHGRDVAMAEREMCVGITDTSKKPFFVGEFGVGPDFMRTVREWDADGLHLHNGLWAPMFSRGAGPAAHWYVSSFIDACDLYHQFKPVSDFVRKIDWLDPELKAMPITAARWAKLPEKLHYVDYIIPTGVKWRMKAAPVSTFDIRDDGTIENSEMISSMLFRSPSRGKPPTFKVHFKQPGRFVVHVSMSVGNKDNALLVFLDGKKVVEKPFPAAKGLGIKTEYVAMYDNYRTAYDEGVTVDVPAGEHEIRVEMRGKDRLELTYILKNYLCFERARPLRIFGMKKKDFAALWIQNTLSTWYNKYTKVKPVPVDGMWADVAGLEDGTYSVEWWDTWKGCIQSTATAESKGGMLTIRVPRVERDIACKIRKVK